jgi:4-hydroxy-tetrahydrodipicolinate reductase
MDAIPATAAQLVNAIPGVLIARSGIVTVKDIPVATAWLDLSKAMLR